LFEIKKALCPIDFSTATAASLDAAIVVARNHGADLYLLHVLEGPAPAANEPLDSTRFESAREAVRARLAELVGEQGDGLHVHLLVSDGSPAEEILRMEEIFGVDLIVLAPHGRPTLGKIIFGSVADKVTRGSRAHILLVKSPAAGADGETAAP
jgi:nucleotide-binding universal stress UspA family protein